jgi:1-deoxy-D-xylulose-5-phosphate reductoisomerase
LRRVTVLGSTGSIGCNTVDLLQRNRDEYRVVALTARNNVELLIQQARELRPEFVAVADPANYAPVRDALEGSGIEVGSGPHAVVEAAERDAEWVMAAIVGT